MCTGMFYMAQENFIQAEMTFQEATKQLRAAEETEDDTQTRTEGGAGEALGISESLKDPVDGGVSSNVYK